MLGSQSVSYTPQSVFISIDDLSAFRLVASKLACVECFQVQIEPIIFLWEQNNNKSKKNYDLAYFMKFEETIDHMVLGAWKTFLTTTTTTTKKNYVKKLLSVPSYVCVWVCELWKEWIVMDGWDDQHSMCHSIKSISVTSHKNLEINFQLNDFSFEIFGKLK